MAAAPPHVAGPAPQGRSCATRVVALLDDEDVDDDNDAPWPTTIDLCSQEEEGGGEEEEDGAGDVYALFIEARERHRVLIGFAGSSDERGAKRPRLG